MRSITSRSFKDEFIRSVHLIAFLMLFSGVSFAQQWQSIAPMNFARNELCAVALPDGRVLVAGGNDGSQVLSSCEIYDPSTNTWTMTGNMHEPRYRFPMIMLQDGRIMAAGGLINMNVGTTDGVELYDPNTGSWTQMAPMHNRRENFPLFQLPNGKIFICGGLDANVPVYLGSAEFYDPSQNQYQELSTMPTAVFGQFTFYDSIHNVIYQQGGSYNGLSGTFPPFLQEYDIATNKWHSGPNSAVSHDGGFNTQLPNGTIILVAGRTGSFTATDSIEILKQGANAWQFVGRLTSPRWHAPAIVSGDDSILAIGGNNDPGVNTNNFDSTNWFFVKEHQTLQGPRMISARSTFAAVLSKQPATTCSHKEVVYVFGGLSNGLVLNACEALTLGTKQNVGQSPQRLHRESASAYFGAVDTLPLTVDISSSINLDSLWPYLTKISATYAWDSSIVNYSAYLPPAGWTLTSLTSHGNSLDFSIQNSSGTASNPLDLGTALFHPHTTQLATSWATLPVLEMEIGGQALSLCVTDNEDSHWAVKTLGAQSGVAPQWAPESAPTTRIYPNPVGNELSIENSGADKAAVTIYDAIGRVVARASIAAGITGTIDVHSLAPGAYVARMVSGGTQSSQVIVKR